MSLLSLWVALSPGVLVAQKKAPDILDLGLEALMKIEVDSVFGASGYKQNVSDAPASITIFTADEIQRYGYRTVAVSCAIRPGST